jgi:hypothetical protein
VRVETRFSVFRYVPFRPLPILAVLVVAHAFLPCAPEPEPWAFVRVFGFLALSLLWVYGVNAAAMTPEAPHGCTECAIYFGSVLFTTLPVAAPSAVALLVTLACLRPSPARPETPPPPLLAEHPPPPPPPDATTDQAPEDVEALFRAARAQALEPPRAKARLRSPGE